MPKKIFFTFLIILILIPSIAKASLFDDLLSQIRGVINNIGISNNKDDGADDNSPTNNANSVNQTPITNFSPSGFCFVNEMQFGDRNTDVKELQKFLSQFPDIYPERLTTGYFGSLTKQAVIRFQNKFKSEILIPAGLKQGTGYVGQYTLDKLNSLNKCTIESIDNSDSDSDINIDIPPVSTPDDSNIIDDEPIEPGPSLPTVKIKAYCSDSKDLFINSASMDSTAEKTDIRKIIFDFENPNYEDATNVTINIGNQIINVGNIKACRDEDNKINIQHFSFDYQCTSNERDTNVTVSWIQNNISKSFTKPIRVSCFQCKSEIPKLGIYQYTIYHKDLQPEKIKWYFPAGDYSCSSNGLNTPYDSGYVAKCFGYTGSQFNESKIKASISDLPDMTDERYKNFIYNPPTASNVLWIYCPLLTPEKTF